DRFFDTFPNFCVSFQIHRGETRMSVVPNFRRQFVPADEMFKFLLVLGAIQDQPITTGITYAVAENEIQTPGDFVDKVVHVAFQAAVIVTREEESLLVIEKYPAREMNAFDASKKPSVENVPRAVVQNPNQKSYGPAAKQIGLYASQCAELVGDVVVLQVRQFFHMFGIGRRNDFRVGTFVATELDNKNGQVQQQERSEQQQHNRHTDEVKKIPHPPSERRRRRRRQGKPTGFYFRVDEPCQVIVDLHGIFGGNRSAVVI